jgi:pimeloyl-ACP methyl ester carboxylesterase
VLLTCAPGLLVFAWLAASAWTANRWYRSQNLPIPPPPSRGTAWYFLREAGFIVRLGWWWIAGFGKDGWWDGHRRAVVCVHGFSQNGTNFLGIRRALQALGHPTRSTSLGRPFQPLPIFVPPLSDGLREAIARSPDGIDVIAHSMGGIILRMALVAEPQLRRHIRRVITLGTPHRGTAGAHGPLALGPESRALMLDAADLLALPDLELLVPDATITTISAGQDHVVYPPENTHLAKSDRVDLRDVGHAGLLVAPESIAEIVARIAADDKLSP